MADDVPNSPQELNAFAIAISAFTLTRPLSALSTSLTASQATTYSLQRTPGVAHDGSVFFTCTGAPLGKLQSAIVGDPQHWLPCFIHRDGSPKRRRLDAPGHQYAQNAEHSCASVRPHARVQRSFLYSRLKTGFRDAAGNTQGRF
jgi:hypothetical protein